MATAIRMIACLCGLLAVSSTPAAAEQAADNQVIREGKDDYQSQCAACHGANGKGDGPMAKILTIPPADLTTIAKNNGGEFPFWRVYRIISGETDVPGHETFQMPDFWKRFGNQAWESGLLPPHVRILELTHYLETLQEK